jgi:hypothetical protein
MIEVSSNSRSETLADKPPVAPCDPSFVHYKGQVLCRYSQTSWNQA